VSCSRSNCLGTSMQGEPAQADDAPPQPPSGALRCPGLLGLQLARELPRRSRRPPIKQKRDTKNGPSETDDRNVTSFDLWVMQICLVINLRTAQHSLSCTALLRNRDFLHDLVREICDSSKSRSNAQAF
jgi:hypothetical protein